MKESDTLCSDYQMSEQDIDAFIASAIEKGASQNMIRRFKASVASLYNFLPEDKRLNKSILQLWRSDMEEKGYASATILNYVKYINKFLDFVGCSSIRFTRGRAKDITGMRFGYLTAKHPTEKRHRRDVVWVCECKCGNMIEIPASRLLNGNTKSCGCIYIELFQRSNKYIDKTSLRQSLDETVISNKSSSGYVGVSRKRNKWLAYITYKGKRYSLGCYDDINDAVKARARAKERVIDDANDLLYFYNEMHKNLEPLPSKRTRKSIDYTERKLRTNNLVLSAAKRRDNTSGHTGVRKNRNRWMAEISYKGVRYHLGSFKNYEDAVAERIKAEDLLKKDPVAFTELYCAKK